MSKKNKIGSITFLALMLGLVSCQKDSPADCDTIPTYNSNVKAIIDANCTLSGCHDGRNGAPGNFKNFQGLNQVTTSGAFTRRVIDIKDMPASGSLTDAEYNTLKCWAAEGFPLQ